MAIKIEQVKELLDAHQFGELFNKLGWNWPDSDAPHGVQIGEKRFDLIPVARTHGFMAYHCPQMPDSAMRARIETRLARDVREHLIIFTESSTGVPPVNRAKSQSGTGVPPVNRAKADCTTNTPNTGGTPVLLSTNTGGTPVPRSSQQRWQWVRRAPGQPLARREHDYLTNQPRLLLEKLRWLEVSLDEEGKLIVSDIADKVQSAFDVDQVTKRFYERFKKEHDAFLSFIEGIADMGDAKWYASVMLNRLMFIYFIQKKGFLDGDTDYLRNRLARVQALKGKDRFHTFYRYFLMKLCHEVLAKKDRTLDKELTALIGQVPYLNGGIFQPHELEVKYGEAISITDDAFQQVFDFFDQYEWHLDNRTVAKANEINPDVLGYIFEKYINQKQMGAYYTKEDITEYISKNTIIPCLFDKAQKACPSAFRPESSTGVPPVFREKAESSTGVPPVFREKAESSTGVPPVFRAEAGCTANTPDTGGTPVLHSGGTVWNLLQADPDRYIYPAVRHGVSYDINREVELFAPVPVPPEIAIGLDTDQPDLLERRKDWNTPAPPEAGLPTEIWRETIARRQRYADVRGKLERGDVRAINDLITLNLDIRQFAQDVIEQAESPDLLNAFWVAIAGRMPQKSDDEIKAGISVLDPTCGSGAFLFAALNVLEPLYEACLKRMDAFLREWQTESSTGVPPVNRAQEERGTGVPPVNRAQESSTGVPPVNRAQADCPENTGGTPVLHSASAPNTGGTPVLRYFNPYDELSVSRRNMPHWEQEGALYFITFRLGDSLPSDKLKQWNSEKEQWHKSHTEPYSEADIEDYAKRFPERLNQWLDAGHGSCMLQEPDVRAIVESALRHFDGERYNLFDYVIMPNHVHLLVQPLPGNELSNLLHSWKSYTAHQINKLKGKNGTIWQDESYDHLVRSESQFEHYRGYIAENPEKATLPPASYAIHTTKSSTEKSSTGVPPVFRAKADGSTAESSTGVPPVFRAKAVCESTSAKGLTYTCPSTDTGGTPVLLSASTPDTGGTPVLLSASTPDTGGTPVLLSHGARSRHPLYAKFFRTILADIDKHPSPQYFIYKSIIVQNLYGVDLMKEAVEICKLRLFLKLVAQVDDGARIEPLPDIDFNIRAGNTLVGFATADEMKRAMQGDLLAYSTVLPEILEQAEDCDRLFNIFRQAQLENDTTLGKAKAQLTKKLAALNDKLNLYLARDYHIKTTPVAAVGDRGPVASSAGRGKSDLRPPTSDFSHFLETHQPFHWFIEFYGIINSGGFDAIIGNPPYVQCAEVKEYNLKDYECIKCGNLYALIIERCSQLSSASGEQGYIVPVSSVSTEGYSSLQQLLSNASVHYSSYDDRPSRLFDGLQHIRLSVHLIHNGPAIPEKYSTRYNKWYSSERDVLFSNLSYAKQIVPLFPGSWGKVADRIEHQIYGKIKSGKSANQQFANRGQHMFFYSRKVGYYLQFLTFKPRVLNRTGELRDPSEFKTVFANNSTEAIALATAFNSNLFYWYLTVFSDCRHVNKREVDAFPVGWLRLNDSPFIDTIAVIGKRLMVDLSNNADDRQMSFKHDTLNVQCIIPKKSKPIIDEIDKVLAQHYGFTEEELDYIINYDIKYRMGKDLQEDEA